MKGKEPEVDKKSIVRGDSLCQIIPHRSCLVIRGEVLCENRVFLGGLSDRGREARGPGLVGVWWEARA